MDPHPDSTPLPQSPADLARLAYEFAATHPSHPMASTLRSKGASLVAIPPGSTPLELALLIARARSLLADEQQG